MSNSTSQVFSFPYLTVAQNTLCSQLDPKLRDIILWRFLPQQKEGIVQARMILAAFEQSDQEHYETITMFFLRLFQDPEEKSLLERFSKLHLNGKTDRFFSHVHTRSLSDIEAVFGSFQDSTRALQASSVFLASKTVHNSKLHALCKQIPLSRLGHEALFSSLQSQNSDLSEADLQEFLDEMIGVYKEYGEELCEAIAIQKAPFEQRLWILKRLRELSNEGSPLKAIADFVHQKLLWADFIIALGNEEVSPHAWSWKEEDLPCLIQKFTQMQFPLPSAHLEKLKTQFLKIQELRKEYSKGKIEDLVKVSRDLRMCKTNPEEERLHFLAIGISAIRLHFNIDLHPTQIMTILGELLFPEGCVAQVKTGEGKSMIVALQAFLLTMEGKKVHIVSSSHQLAKRDQQKYTQFFALFDISTSHICDRNPEAKHFQAHIIYGTASDFEFAIMREMLYFKTLFPENPLSSGSVKRFDCVIVDEVDNLTIDTLRHGARLAMPAEISYDWVYPPIIQFVQQKKEGTIAQLRDFLSSYQERRYSAFVTGISDEKLESWLRSALHAQYKLKEDCQYDIQETGEGKKICIIDADNTGRRMDSSRWAGGVHEFVEAKHSIPVEKESLTPLSISHPVYYDMYRSIFGLTGTLGSKFEREEIYAIYKVASFDVPTHNPPKRVDQPPRIVSSLQKVLNETLASVQHCKTTGRPILVLCETISFSKEVSALLSSHKISHEILNETQQQSEEFILSLAGNPEAVTVATNTAGRGTDIQLKAESLSNGGLHVLLTFFPSFLRVEEQARGRAGRQGQPGTSEIIFASSDSLESLLAKRELSTQLTKELHVYLSQLDRYRFGLAKQFFTLVTSYNTLESRLSSLARIWAPRRLLSSFSNLEKLSPKDGQIAKEAIALLTNPTRQEEKWLSVIESAQKRLQKLIIQDWAVEFHQKVDDLISDSGIEQLVRFRATLDQIHPKIAQEFIPIVMHSYFELHAKIQALFTEKQVFWDKYLNGNGSGINLYLESVIKGSLPLQT